MSDDMRAAITRANAEDGERPADRSCIPRVGIESRRSAYADHLVACADTVAILRPDEVSELHRRAQSGEFDAELDWRSPYLNAARVAK